MVRIDLGKIIALHNAGWSSAKIADEMRMAEDAMILISRKVRG